MFIMSYTNTFIAYLVFGLLAWLSKYKNKITLAFFLSINENLHDLNFIPLIFFGIHGQLVFFRSSVL